MPDKVTQASQAPIALNQPFARRSKPKFESVPPLPPRTPTQRIAHAFKSLGNRIAYVIRPNSARTGDVRVGSLKAADKAMVDLLANVLNGTTSVQALADDIQQFSESAASVLRTGNDENVTLAGLIDIRANVHLAHMSLPDLQRLATQLDKAIKVSAVSGNEHSLQVLSVLKGIGRQVQRELASRAVLDACKAALHASPAGPEAVAEQFDQALRAADSALTRLGTPQDGTLAAKSRPYALVKEILNDLLEKGTLSRESMQTLFRALPSDLQGELLASDKNKKPMFNATGSVDALLRDTITQQWRDLKQAVADHCIAVDTTDPSKNLPYLADQLTHLANQWSALQEHNKQHKLPGDRPLDLEVSDVLMKLSARLRPDLLQSQLGRLESRQLVAFSSALRSLGVEADCLDSLTAEVRKRKKESLLTPGNHLLEACNHLSLGQLPKALDWLSSAIDATPAALRVNMALGNTRWKGAEGYTAFQNHVIGDALDRLAQKELARLHATLSANRTAELALRLQEIGFVLEDASDPKGDRFRKMGMALETLSSELAKRVPASDDAGPPDDEPLDAATLQVVSQFTGVKVFPGGTIGVVYDSPKVAFQNNLDATLAKPTPSFTPENEKTGSGVSEAMYRELKTATYVIAYSDNYREPLFGDEASRIDQLRTNAGLSADELLRLSQVANKNLWASLDAAGTSAQNSPVQLPDGTPVKLVGQPKNTFTVHRGPAPDERLFVRCEQVLDPLVAATNPATGTSTPLDLTKSGAWFSVELEIGKDGKVRLSKPLTCSYALVPKTT